MSTDKKEKLIQKIQALRAKTLENGCIEEEAYAAAVLVEKLMNDYDISLTEVEFREILKRVLRLMMENRFLLRY